MSSDLPIALDGGRSLLQVGPFQNSVLPVFLLNLQHCVLHPLFSLQVGSFALALVLLGGVIREQVKLFSFRLPGGLAFRNDMVGREVNLGFMMRLKSAITASTMAMTRTNEEYGLSEAYYPLTVSLSTAAMPRRTKVTHGIATLLPSAL